MFGIWAGWVWGFRPYGTQQWRGCYKNHQPGRQGVLVLRCFKPHVPVAHTQDSKWTCVNRQLTTVITWLDLVGMFTYAFFWMVMTHGHVINAWPQHFGASGRGVLGLPIDRLNICHKKSLMFVGCFAGDFSQEVSPKMNQPVASSTLQVQRSYCCGICCVMLSPLTWQ